METAGLFGVSGRSNRDTTQKSHWGKNEFNSSYPTALLCYMHSKNIKPVIIRANAEGRTSHEQISVKDLFCVNPTSDSLYFS
ncbi:MAG TPA: HindVP family restriction endonuclease, partial [Bacteroidota bacterium]|nr:HindVP family restriction endonuclease [Bacteroidota bacterium]